MTTRMTWAEEKAAIAEAASRFPAQFGLRGHPGRRFRVSVPASYFSGNTLTLYTAIKATDGRWLDFAKATPGDLAREVTP